MTTTPPTTAPEFLHQAANIMAARAAQYDQPGGERSMGKCVQAFNAITGHDLSEASGWLLLQLLKDVRQWQTPGKFHRDSVEDGVAYSALKAEALARDPAAASLAYRENCPEIHGKCKWVPVNYTTEKCTACSSLRDAR